MRWIVCCVVYLWLGLGFTQVNITDSASLLEQAKQASQEAITTYQTYDVDKPLWREAMRLGTGAQNLDPENPDIALFLAQTYSYTKWYIRAWTQWQKYLSLGKTLNDAVGQVGDLAKTQFLETGTELGFAAYEAENLEGALSYYKAVNDIVSDDVETLTWLGRIYLELGQPDEARPYWERASELDPDNENIGYFSSIIEEQVAVGSEASTMFQTGIRAYEEGKLEEALQAFEWATSANDTFTQAYVWAGRTSLELGESDLAVLYWSRVRELDPSDERAEYFLEVAQTQVDYGAEAANAFYEGQMFYSQQNLNEAAKSFERATKENKQYKEAFVWAARSYQELGNFDKAIPFWERVLDLDPSDTRASYFLLLAKKQISDSTPSGAAFMAGITYYQQNDFENAEASFKKAVQADDDFADGWGWLGRVYFTIANYSEAATAYARAAKLAPGNSDYEFFADEAKRLAGD
ncbi:MAG: tetratricopeptide repeat protein [Trueperaceae bacterium]